MESGPVLAAGADLEAPLAPQLSAGSRLPAGAAPLPEETICQRLAAVFAPGPADSGMVRAPLASPESSCDDADRPAEMLSDPAAEHEAQASSASAAAAANDQERVRPKSEVTELISRVLLEELSNEPMEWQQEAGYGTPSSARSVEAAHKDANGSANQDSWEADLGPDVEEEWSSMESKVLAAQLKAQHIARVRAYRKDSELAKEKLQRMEIEKAQVLVEIAHERKQLEKSLNGYRSQARRHGLNVNESADIEDADTGGGAKGKNGRGSKNAKGGKGKGGKGASWWRADGYGDDTGNGWWGENGDAWEPEGGAEKEKKTVLRGKMRDLDRLLKESCSGIRQHRARCRPGNGRRGIILPFGSWALTGEARCGYIEGGAGRGGSGATSSGGRGGDWWNDSSSSWRRGGDGGGGGAWEFNRWGAGGGGGSDGWRRPTPQQELSQQHHGSRPSAGVGAAAPLDPKMQRLNALIQETSAQHSSLDPQRGSRRPGDQAPSGTGENGAGGASASWRGGDQGTIAEGAIVSTLQEMFPQVSVRLQGPDGAAVDEPGAEVRGTAERAAGGGDDADAERGFRPPRRQQRTQVQEEVPTPGSDRDGDEDDDDYDEDEESDGAGASGGGFGGGARDRDGGEEDGAVGAEEERWTEQRIARAAQRRFEMRWRGNKSEVKMSIGGKRDPPLTEVGMQRYCSWLGRRLDALKEEYGPDILQQSRVTVDFSHCGLTDKMVWTLLQAIVNFELNVVVLKLFGNEIGQGGVLAICEYITKSQQVEPLQELHLSHNNIQGPSVLELLRTIKARSLRPIARRRAVERGGDERCPPVWLQVNRNLIEDPQDVLRQARAEGIVVCESRERTSGSAQGEDSPLVQMYRFCEQSTRGSREAGTSSGRHRQSARGPSGANASAGAGSGGARGAGGGLPRGGRQWGSGWKG
eukprot:TRINITY_DN3190_c1_g1_i1.p1 TRINITY_DN3190_c1_g1~~TRINITY_DN3190_c1_g1_i1.p1  ORF type:complete len:937 (+),score=247.50 TRINITY_DN3190_c1_g1_i1:37-2811(+)